MLILYYSPGSCSITCHIALKHAGADFEARRFSTADGENRAPEYLGINPRGLVPALKVGDTVITENIAVLSYVTSRYPNSGLLPNDDPVALARCYERLSFFASSVHVAFAQFWRMERFSDDVTLHPAIREGGRAAIVGFFDDIESMIAGRDWFVGPAFSVADLYPFAFYRWGRRIGFDMNRYVGWAAHVDRMLALPSVAAVIEREGLTTGEFRNQTTRGSEVI